MRQIDIGDICCCFEQWGNLCRCESGNAATYLRDEESHLGMCLGKVDKLVYIGFYGFRTAMHGGDAVGLSLQSGALSPNGTPLPPGK